LQVKARGCPGQTSWPLDSLPFPMRENDSTLQGCDKDQYNRADDE
jgi:hypothetical protein